MNNGFRNYTKRITQQVGNVAEVSVNINKADNNLHITMPLVSTVGQCPLSTSLIFDLQSKNERFGFGYGTRLNYYSLVEHIDGGYQMTNNDGTVDKYLEENEYFNVETGLTVTECTDTYDMYTYFKVEDDSKNYIEYISGEKYPKITQKSNGEKIIFDTVSAPNSIRNEYGDRIDLLEEGDVIREVRYIYHDDSSNEDKILTKTAIIYGNNGYIKELVYYNINGKVVNRLSLSFSSDEIIVMDAISGYRVCYTLVDGKVQYIRDGFDDEYTRGNIIEIDAIDGKTTVTDKYGKTSYVVFDSDNYPLYEVDNYDNVTEYEFDKETKQLKFQSNPMDLKRSSSNLVSGVTPVFVADDDSNGCLLTENTYRGKGTLTYRVETSGIATDNLTALVSGKFCDESYSGENATVRLKLLSENNTVIRDSEKTSSIANPHTGDVDVAIVGSTAKSSYAYIELSVDIPEGATVMIEKVKLLKKECGAFYKYDNRGNVIEAVAGNRSGTATYEAGKITESIAENSAIVNNKYNEKNQLVSSTHAYGAKVEYEYDAVHSNNLSKTTVTSADGTVVLKTDKTYTPDGRFLASETDANGLTKSYTYLDQHGNIRSVRDTLSVVTNYSYFENGLLEELELTDGTSSARASYTYDDKRRISDITLTNGSKYSFVYDSFDNITIIRLNGVTVFRYEYDNDNRLIKQYYGNSNDGYQFVYNSSSLIDRIFYVKSGENATRNLKYLYQYDMMDRVAEITTADDEVLYIYEYDDDGRVYRISNDASSIELGYDNLGNMNTKKATVAGKTVYQSFDTVDRSKGSHPAIVLARDVIDHNGTYTGMFYEDAVLRDAYGDALYPVFYEGLESDVLITSDGYIPCCQLDNNHQLTYQLTMRVEDKNERGYVAYAFKPTKIDKQFLFSARSAFGIIYAFVNFDQKVEVEIVDSYAVVHPLITSTNTVKIGEWNYFAIEFIRRFDEFAPNVFNVNLNVNGHIDSYTDSSGIQFELGANPIYSIGYWYTGSEVYRCLDAKITGLTISPRMLVGLEYMHKHYVHMRDYVFENALITENGEVSTVDFSDTNLYTTDEYAQNMLEIYPLHNSVASLNGKLPVVFEHRSIGEVDKNRNFAFNKTVKRYAYVAEGYGLEYSCNSSKSGTIMMRAYIKTSGEKQYFFDTKDDSGNTLGLFRDSSQHLCIAFNTETIDTGIIIDNNSWRTVALSYNTQICSDSVNETDVHIRVYVDGEVYEILRHGDFGASYISVGRSYTSDAASGFVPTNDDYRPLRGQIEMLGISEAFLDFDTIDNLDYELTTYTKTSEFDDLGMLRKTSVHHGANDVISTVITYKKNGDNTTQCVAEEKFSYNQETRTRTYTTDLYGRVTAVSDTVLGNHTYEYDYRGFLVKEDNTEFAYDGNGNITRAGNKVFTYDSVIKDRLMSVGGKPITYSEINPLNPKTYDGKTFEFEGRRLVKVTSDNMVATYKYDESGLRTEKTVTENGVTTTTKFIYHSGKLITEYTDSTILDYLYDENGMLYGFIHDGAKYFYIRDTQMNILGIVNHRGVAVVHYNYTAYGECKSILGSMAGTIGTINSFGYKGYYLDSETGLFYCNARYYLPQWKRFLNSDLMEYIDPASINTCNLYCYCNNDSINKVDDSGRFAISALIAGAIIGAVVGFATVAATDYKNDGEIFNGSVEWYEYACGTVTGAALGAGAGGIISAGGAVLSSAVASTTNKFISDMFAYSLTGAKFGTWEDYAVAFVSGGLVKGLGIGKTAKTIYDVAGRPFINQAVKIATTTQQGGFKEDKYAYDVITRGLTTSVPTPWKAFYRGGFKSIWDLKKKGYFE